MHGEPVYPDYIFRSKYRLLNFLANEKFEKYVVECVYLDVPKFGLSNNEFEKQQIVEGDIKQVSITFKNKDGVLHNFVGKEALDVVKNLSKK